MKLSELFPLQPEAPGAFRDAFGGAGWNPGVAPWPSSAVTHLPTPGIYGFMLHPRENKRDFGQGKDKSSPSPLQQPPAQGLGRVL